MYQCRRAQHNLGLDARGVRHPLRRAAPELPIGSVAANRAGSTWAGRTAIDPLSRHAAASHATDGVSHFGAVASSSADSCSFNRLAIVCVAWPTVLALNGSHDDLAVAQPGDALLEDAELRRVR